MGLTFCRCGLIAGDCDCGGSSVATQKSTTERGYGYDWQKLSRSFRKENPLCWRCLELGKTKPSEHVHHIVPITVDRTRRMDRTNLAALCSKCHEIVEREAAQGLEFAFRPG